MKNKFYIRKKAQVWIETAIYTLIGLTIIGILITSATPQIEKIKDRGIITQTTEALNVFNNEIFEIEQAGGAERVVYFTVKKGRLEIDPNKSIIQYVLEDTRLEFTEENTTVKEGNIDLLTKKRGSRFDIFLTMNYTDRLDMTFNGLKTVKVLHAGTTPYKIQIENVGDNEANENTHINFELL
jgi:type II secretory pathway pseudopilin PulG